MLKYSLQNCELIGDIMMGSFRYTQLDWGIPRFIPCAMKDFEPGLPGGCPPACFKCPL